MRFLVPALVLSLLLPSCVDPGAVQALTAADSRTSAAVADQVRRCYRNPRVPASGRRIVTRLLVAYAPDGTLIGMPLVVWQQGVTAESRRYAGRMTEAAREAVVRCAPVSLPPEKGKAASKPREFFLTFSPLLAA